MAKVTIIGGGLAGSEAAYFLLKRGYEVTLFEARPSYVDNAHQSGMLGELVCSNSLKSKQLDNACGLLKEEIRRLGSIMMEASGKSEVPAGNALSVDRVSFASYITERLLSFPAFHLVREEVRAIPDDGHVIIATGPLTSPGLLESLSSLAGAKALSFFDASAPIVKRESIDFSIAYFKSRYGQDDASYINCPFTKEEYYRFVNELLSAKKALIHQFDTAYFEGCLPVEVIASRGMETLRHGPLKPFGLETPEHPKPYAVAQLRQDSLLGDLYNIVGFQTNLTYPEQKRVFSLIPGLGKAEFVRYGLMHRNSYLDSPSCLNEDFSFKANPNIFLAGQLTGVEGYVESAASGLVSAIYLARKLEGKPFVPLPKDTVLGALLYYVTHACGRRLEPMNANWALIPSSRKKSRDVDVMRALDSLADFAKRAL